MADQATTETTPTAAAPQAAAQPAVQGQFIWGTGRRKKAIARVRLMPGTGEFVVNKQPVEKYFKINRDRSQVMLPLTTANMVKAFNVWANVRGGGPTGQAGALTMGLARALCKAMPEIESALRDKGLLTRDARMKERKKYGQKGARRRFQYSKR